MPQTLYTLRVQLSQIPSMIKQEKYFSAVQTMYDAVKQIMGSALLKQEQEEFHQLIKNGCDSLGNTEYILKIFPLKISFEPTNPAILLNALAELLQTLQTETTQTATLLAAAIRKKKDEALDKGQHELDAGEHAQAHKTLLAVVTEFADDAQLAVEAGEKFMRHGLYEHASEFFQSSLAIKPNSPKVYNRLGIALRKIKRFEAAEENFKKALAIDNNDPHLYFNLSRLYLDWNKLAEALHWSEKALILNPAFTEAAQLSAYLNKKSKE